MFRKDVAAATLIFSPILLLGVTAIHAKQQHQCCHRYVTKEIAPRTGKSMTFPPGGTPVAGAKIITAANGGILVQGFAKEARLHVGPIKTDGHYRLERIVKLSCKHNASIGDEITSAYFVNVAAAPGLKPSEEQEGPIAIVKPQVSMEFQSDLQIAPVRQDAFKGIEVEVDVASGGSFTELSEPAPKIKVFDPFDLSTGLDKNNSQTKNFAKHYEFDEFASLRFTSTVSITLESELGFPLIKGGGAIGISPPKLIDFEENVGIQFGSESDFVPGALPTDPNNGAFIVPKCDVAPFFFSFTNDQKAQDQFFKKAQVQSLKK